MDDALFMSVFEGGRDLSRQADGLRHVQGPALETIGEGGSADIFHDQGRDALHFLQSMNHRNIGMIQRGQDLRLVLEPGFTLGIGNVGRREHFNGNVAEQPGISRAVHLAHPAGADQFCDFVYTDPRPGPQRPVRYHGAILSSVFRHLGPGAEDDPGAIAKGFPGCFSMG